MYQRLKSDLIENPKIIDVSEGTAPGDEDYPYEYRTEETENINNDLIYTVSDYNYINTLGIQVLNSETSLNEEERPQSSILINETLARRISGNPIGKKIILFPGSKLEQIKTINGVFKDYHFFSLHQTIAPQMLLLREFSPAPGRKNVLVKINAENTAETIDFIQKKVESITPNEPIQFRFIDDDLNKYYQQEQKLSDMSNRLLFISFFLALAGLVGIASYVTELRTKEIGIRKILGASTFSILTLLAESFFVSIVIAAVMGAFQLWLNNFAFKTAIRWEVYAATGCIALIVALATILLMAAKAAKTNPVETLKSE